jgi:ssDNA-specific exonuclease RecJ
MSFDKALHFLSEITRTELFTSTYEQLLSFKKFDVRTLHQQLDAFNISNKLLVKLKKEYELSLTMAEK